MCKNKCIFFDLPLLDDFVSNLLYPAILGSLIYEFTAFKLCQYEKYIFMFITAIFYIVDYFYMHYAFTYYKNKNNEEIRSCHMIRLDILDTLSFALIILFINKSWFNLIIFPILAIFFVEEYYIEDSEPVKCCKRIIKAFLCSFILTFIIIVLSIVTFNFFASVFLMVLIVSNGVIVFLLLYM